MAIVWGSAVGSGNKQFRIGINVILTNVSNTQTERETQIWVWTKYGVDDSSNTLYYNDNTSLACCSR